MVVVVLVSSSRSSSSSSSTTATTTTATTTTTTTTATTATTATPTTTSTITTAIATYLAQQGSHTFSAAIPHAAPSLQYYKLCYVLFILFLSNPRLSTLSFCPSLSVLLSLLVPSLRVCMPRAVVRGDWAASSPPTPPIPPTLSLPPNHNPTHTIPPTRGGHGIDQACGQKSSAGFHRAQSRLMLASGVDQACRTESVRRLFRWEGGVTRWVGLGGWWDRVGRVMGWGGIA